MCLLLFLILGCTLYEIILMNVLIFTFGLGCIAYIVTSLQGANNVVYYRQYAVNGFIIRTSAINMCACKFFYGNSFAMQILQIVHWSRNGLLLSELEEVSLMLFPIPPHSR